MNENIKKTTEYEVMFAALVKCEAVLNAEFATPLNREGRIAMEARNVARYAIAYGQQKPQLDSELLAALNELVANQEDGWRQTGTMPEEHIKAMPYLRRARAAIANAQDYSLANMVAKSEVELPDYVWRTIEYIRSGYPQFIPNDAALSSFSAEKDAGEDLPTESTNNRSQTK
jgi:hypothetical protein